MSARHWQRSKFHVERALARGTAAGLVHTAIYLPGEQVRCPGLPGEDVCGGFLFVRGDAGPVHVRVLAERRQGERSTRERPERRRGDEHRCPRCDGHRLEVVSPSERESAA